jgi:hypothetical protein
MEKFAQETQPGDELPEENEQELGATGSPPEEERILDWGATQAYFEHFLQGDPSTTEIKELANSLIREYPADAEALTALAELPGYFSAQRALDRLRDEGHTGLRFTNEERRNREKKKKDLLIRLTQNQFLLTDIVVKFAQNHSYLDGFWKSTELLANFKDAEGMLGRTKESVLAQASIYQLFTKLGKHPHLSHPNEDAFNAIDLWVDEGDRAKKQAVQVKGAPKKKEFSVVPATETISFPGVALQENEKQKHYNAYTQNEHDKFCAKLDQYNKETHQAIEGYLIVIPRDRRDPTTGEPDAELVEEARERLR